MAAALVGAATAADDSGASDEVVLEAALARPHATGLLVVETVPGQCQAAGVRAGDVLVRYDGAAVRTLDALNEAKAAVGERTEVPSEWARPDGTKLELTLEPGPLGLHLAPVEKGRPPAALPPDSGHVLDVALAGDRDEWMAFSIGGREYGLEHVRVRTADGVLHLDHEVAFDAGDEIGRHHSRARIAVRLGVTAEPLAIEYELFLADMRAVGELRRDEAGRAVWHVETTTPDGEQTHDRALRGDVSVLQTYLVAQIARLLPQEEGACFVFRPVSDFDGKPGLRAAVHCVGSETLEIDGVSIPAWKYVQRNLAGANHGEYWFDADRRLVQATYGGPMARIATRERVVPLVRNPDIRLRTAD